VSERKDSELTDSYRPISLLPCARKLLEKMLCLEYSSNQYDFRKGRQKRDCLALLTTDVQTSFERKQQTVVAFIDTSGAYDNVLIEILCDILREKEVHLQVERFLLRLLWLKELVFFAGGQECMTLVGNKGLLQGSVLTLNMGRCIKGYSDV
jgi:hypothetical protein